MSSKAIRIAGFQPEEGVMSDQSDTQEVKELLARTASSEQLQQAEAMAAQDKLGRMDPSLLDLRERAEPLGHFEDAARQARILQAILRSMGAGVVVADENGKFLLFNPAAEQILGIGPEDVSPAEWSQRYGCYLPDQLTLYPSEQ